MSILKINQNNIPMSLAENLNLVQRENFIVMEEIASNKIVQNTGHILSSQLYTTLIKQSILYRNDKIEFFEIEYQNQAICIQLIDGEITAQEAAIQSNSLWIDFINSIRSPSVPKLNISTLPRLNVYNF